MGCLGRFVANERYAPFAAPCAGVVGAAAPTAAAAAAAAPPPCASVVTLREPLARALSHFAHDARTGALAPRVTAKDYWADRAAARAAAARGAAAAAPERAPDDEVLRFARHALPDQVG